MWSNFTDGTVLIHPTPWRYFCWYQPRGSELVHCPSWKFTGLSTALLCCFASGNITTALRKLPPQYSQTNCQKSMKVRWCFANEAVASYRLRHCYRFNIFFAWLHDKLKQLAILRFTFIRSGWRRFLHGFKGQYFVGWGDVRLRHSYRLDIFLHGLMTIWKWNRTMLWVMVFPTLRKFENQNMIILH